MVREIFFSVGIEDRGLTFLVKILLSNENPVCNLFGSLYPKDIYMFIFYAVFVIPYILFFILFLFNDSLLLLDVINLVLYINTDLNSFHLNNFQIDI